VEILHLQVPSSSTGQYRISTLGTLSLLFMNKN